MTCLRLGKEQIEECDGNRVPLRADDDAAEGLKELFHRSEEVDGEWERSAR